MLDQILGRPSPTVRRSQILLVLFFWIWRLYKGDGAPRPGQRIGGPAGGANLQRALKKRGWAWRLWVALVGRRAVRWIAKINDRLKNFTPYQLILGTLTVGYAFRHIGDIFGLAIPEPLASLYSRSYYRATYVNTAFDAGFASAMAIRPKWLKDISSILFAFYYLIYANEGDDVLRKFRALCTVEMLRTTWEKTNNPYIRLFTAGHRPSVGIVKHLTIPRPPTSFRANLPPVKAMLFFAGTEDQLAKASQLVVDYPGGGFIAMGPECHEERLRRWAKRTGKPVLGIDYGKAPEYPYPWAIEEGFDAYRTLMETKGSVIGIKSGKLDVVLTGDSAGGNICATIMLRILEHPTGIPRPVSMILAYPALDFNYTSWMSPTNLRVLRTEQSEVNIQGIVHGKDHLRHKSPLSVVDDVQPQRRTRQASWSHTIGKLAMSPLADKKDQNPLSPKRSTWTRSLPRSMSTKVANWLAAPNGAGSAPDQERTAGEETMSEASDSDDDTVTIKDGRSEADKSLRERVKTPRAERQFVLTPVKQAETTGGVDAELAMSGEANKKPKKKRNPVGTRLTMTSRSGYFQDRIISPSMMRAMAILYIGPGRSPDFETDYYISPILSPPHLLEFFPPVYLICGERDPFVDDTIIFAGKIREAKRARRARAEASLSQSARHAHGEGLRMTTGTTGSSTPDHIVRETDDDWVSMRIIEGWGHGFMQMSALMREVDSVLVEMADWIDESFEKHNLKQAEAKRVDLVRKAADSASVPPDEVLAPEEYMPPSTSTHVKPVGLYKDAAGQIHLGGADLGTPVGMEGGATGAAGGSDEEDPPIMFTPKTKKRGPPPSRFNPVPRRSSKDKLNLYRVSSAPKFDLDETGSSGEAMTIKTPPLCARALPSGSGETPKGHGAFAFFGGRSTTTPAPGSTPGSTGSGTPKSTPPPASLFAPRRTSTGAGTASRPTNSLVAAAVAGARAASPALAAAGLVSQPVEVVSEAELIRRRRFEPFFGVAQTDSADCSDDES